MSHAPAAAQPALAGLFPRDQTPNVARSGHGHGQGLSSSIRSADASTMNAPSLVTMNRGPCRDAPEEEGWSSGSESGSIPLWPARHNNNTVTHDDMASRRDATVADGGAPSQSIGVSTTMKSTSSKWPTVTTTASSAVVSCHSIGRQMHAGSGAHSNTTSGTYSPRGPRALPPRGPALQHPRPAGGDPNPRPAGGDDDEDAYDGRRARSAPLDSVAALPAPVAGGWSSEEDDADNGRQTTGGGNPVFCSVSTKSNHSPSPTFSTNAHTTPVVAATPTPAAAALPDSSPSRMRGEALAAAAPAARQPPSSAKDTAPGADNAGWSSDDDSDVERDVEVSERNTTGHNTATAAEAAAAFPTTRPPYPADPAAQTGDAQDSDADAGGWSSDDADDAPDLSPVPSRPAKSAAPASPPHRRDPNAAPAAQAAAVSRPPLAVQQQGPLVQVPMVRRATQHLATPKAHPAPTPSTDPSTGGSGWSSDDDDADGTATTPPGPMALSAAAATAASADAFPAAATGGGGLGALFPGRRAVPEDPHGVTPQHHSISVDGRAGADDSMGAGVSMREARWHSFGQTMMTLQPLTASATSGNSRETFAEGLRLGGMREIDPLALESAHVDDLAYEKFCYAFAAIRLTTVLARALRYRGAASASGLRDARSRVEAAYVAARELPRHAIVRTATSAGTWARLVTVVEKALEKVALRNLTPQRAHPELCDIHVVVGLGGHDRSSTQRATEDGAGGWSDDEDDATGSPPSAPLSSPEGPAYTARDWLAGELVSFSDRRRASLGEWAALRWAVPGHSAAHPERSGRQSGGAGSADSETDLWEHVKSHIGMDEVVPGVFCGSWQPAADTAELARAGISHVVSCIGIRAPAPATTTVLDMNDRSDQRIDPDSTTGLNAIRRHCLEAGRRVLVHCGSGVSRAPLIIVYSLARMFDLPADIATSLVRTGRPCICLNNGFREQLIATFTQTGGHTQRDSSSSTTDRSASTASTVKRQTPSRKATTPPMPPRGADGSSSARAAS